MSFTARLSPRDRRILADAADRVLADTKRIRPPDCAPCAQCAMSAASQAIVASSRTPSSFGETASVRSRINRVSMRVFGVRLGDVYPGGVVERPSRRLVADYLVALEVMG